MHIFLNALAASAGGGITYVRNVLPHLAEHADVETSIALTSTLRSELEDRPNIHSLECNVPARAVLRLLFEQRRLPELIREQHADVLISAGNFALWNSPVPQILLSRSSLYTSNAFSDDLRKRRHYGLWFDTKLKGIFAAASIRRADITVAPTAAFAEVLRRWTKIKIPARILAIHHGFDSHAFCDSGELPSALAERLNKKTGTLRLLFVSHYNYYRNFATLLRALPIIKDRLRERHVELLLTCNLTRPEHSAGYRPSSEQALIEPLGIRANVVEVGAVPYTRLHHVYRSSDIYVTPAYTETFAHPLVEAMASALPIVASDLAVHREICGKAALYFQPFSAEELAAQVVSLAQDAVKRQGLAEEAQRRVRDFSWSRHVDDLLHVARGLMEKRAA
jgi:glycosyltransferase involved in cell wall biosynthesis